MNHELVMLRGVSYCKRKVKKLNEQCLRMALRSFSGGELCGGTMGQIMAVCELSNQRDFYLSFLNLIEQALCKMPNSYRALLLAVYVKEVSKEALCQKYNVSLSTVYRKLTKARECFKSKLELLGCDETTFERVFCVDDHFCSLLHRKHNGSRIEI